jgi:hypothetical protein
MYRRKRHSSVPPPQIEHSGDEAGEEGEDDDDEVIMSSPYQPSTLVRTPTRPRGPREIGSTSPVDTFGPRPMSPTPVRKKVAQLHDGPSRPQGVLPSGGGPRRVSGQKRGAPPDEFESPQSAKKLVFTADDDRATTVKSKASGSASSSSSSSTINRERPNGTSHTSSPPDEGLANGDRPSVMMQIQGAHEEVRYPFPVCLYEGDVLRY